MKLTPTLICLAPVEVSYSQRSGSTSLSDGRTRALRPGCRVLEIGQVDSLQKQFGGVGIPMYVQPLAQKQVLELHQSIDAWILAAKIGEHALHDYVPVSGFASAAEKTFHSDAEHLRIKFQITSIPLRSLIETEERLDA